MIAPAPLSAIAKQIGTCLGCPFGAIVARTARRVVWRKARSSGRTIGMVDRSYPRRPPATVCMDPASYRRGPAPAILIDCPQDGRMERVLERGEGGVPAIRGEDVLRQ